ncbi:PIN domain-containing protein [Patescibacteria group bacterium]|nr:PIN domain-containing protein [Patescibacteria group bacterium]
MKVFLDTDVIISSFLSSSGASYYLINESLNITEFYISNFSVKEIEIVTKRLKIQNKLKDLKSKLNVTDLDYKSSDIKKLFGKYVYDINDAHIVIAAKQSHSRFLLTYNIKDYDLNLIKKDLDITILEPGVFIQYLRSIEN